MAAGRPKGYKKTGGRAPGTVNRTTASVREALAFVYDGLGHHPAFLKWAKGEPTEFYKIYAKQLPMEAPTQKLGTLVVRWEDEQS